MCSRCWLYRKVEIFRNLYKQKALYFIFNNFYQRMNKNHTYVGSVYRTFEIIFMVNKCFGRYLTHCLVAVSRCNTLFTVFCFLYKLYYFFNNIDWLKFSSVKYDEAKSKPREVLIVTVLYKICFYRTQAKHNYLQEISLSLKCTTIWPYRTKR